MAESARYRHNRISKGRIAHRPVITAMEPKNKPGSFEEEKIKIPSKSNFE
jgi:hypothetical protein